MIWAALVPGITAGAPPPFPACIDYHCDRLHHVQLDEAQWGHITGVLTRSNDPARERHAIRTAIALLEQHVGERTGTWRDLARNRAGAGLAGQLDCIAESRNTSTYLRLLQDHDLLRWHQVEQAEKRQRWIFSIHWTAVIRETTTGQRYAVDSWYLDNGQPPYVQPLDDWRHGRKPIEE